MYAYCFYIFMYAYICTHFVFQNSASHSYSLPNMFDSDHTLQWICGDTQGQINRSESKFSHYCPTTATKQQKIVSTVIQMKHLFLLTFVDSMAACLEFKGIPCGTAQMASSHVVNQCNVHTL